MKLTPWFPPSVLPVREGVYQRDCGWLSRCDGYAHWNGRRWSPARPTPAEAHAMRDFSSGLVDSDFTLGTGDWRGLAEPPK